MMKYILSVLSVLFLCACGASHTQALPSQPVSSSPTPAPQSEGQAAWITAGDVWVEDLLTSTPRRLTNDGQNASPRWSPSGTWVAFVKHDSQLWVARADG